MKAPRVYLTRRPAKLKSGKVAYYWTLKFHDRQGRTRWESIGRAPPPPRVMVPTARAHDELSRASAEALRREKIRDLGNGMSPDKPSRMKLSQFADFHEKAFGAGRRPATLQEWRIAAGHAVAALGDKALEQLAWSDAAQIRAHLERPPDPDAKKPRRSSSKATVRKTLATLRGMLGRVASKGLIRENPLADEQLGPRVARTKRIFGAAEVQAMTDVAPDATWRILVTLAATSGLRRGELLHLRWSDVDLEAGTVRVQEHQAGRHDAKGVDVPILEWTPKTRRSTRSVPLPPQTVAGLQELAARAKLADGSPYVFLSVRRLRAIDARSRAGTLRARFDLANNFNRQFDLIQAAAAVKLSAGARSAWPRSSSGPQGLHAWPHGCFHDLRKTFATWAATAKVPIHELQAHLGHSSITTTAEFYTEVEKSAADRLRAVFAAG